MSIIFNIDDKSRERAFDEWAWLLDFLPALPGWCCAPSPFFICVSIICLLLIQFLANEDGVFSRTIEERGGVTRSKKEVVFAVRKGCHYCQFGEK